MTSLNAVIAGKSLKSAGLDVDRYLHFVFYDKILQIYRQYWVRKFYRHILSKYRQISKKIRLQICTFYVQICTFYAGGIDQNQCQCVCSPLIKMKTFSKVHQIFLIGTYRASNQ